MVPPPSTPAALSEVQPAKLAVPLPSMPAALSEVQPAKLAVPLQSMPAGSNFAERPIACPR